MITRVWMPPAGAQTTAHHRVLTWIVVSVITRYAEHHSPCTEDQIPEVLRRLYLRSVGRGVYRLVHHLEQPDPSVQDGLISGGSRG